MRSMLHVHDKGFTLQHTGATNFYNNRKLLNNVMCTHLSLSKMLTNNTYCENGMQGLPLSEKTAYAGRTVDRTKVAILIIHNYICFYSLTLIIWQAY